MYPVTLIFGRSIPTFAICIAVGLALAMLLILFTHKLRGVRRDDAYYCAIFAFIGGSVGAKLLYIIVEFPAIISDLSRLPELLVGGAVFYGGLIGGVLAGYLYLRRYSLPFLSMADVLLPSLALGQSAGRVGCFFNGCCYGMPWDGCLAVVYPDGGYAPGGVPIMPVQLFESAFLLLLTGALLLILYKDKRPGMVTGWYLTLYGLWRFGIEFFRTDPRGGLWIFSTSQIISLLLIPAGVLIILRAARKSRNTDELTNKP